MRVLRFILAACVFLTGACAGTSDATEDQPADHPIVCDKPEAGKVVNISYDSGHPDAYYRDADSLVATITINSKQRTRYHRLLLKRDGKVFASVYTVPEDAAFFSVAVSPPGVIRSPEIASSVVYLGDDYVENGLCHMMRMSRSLPELDELLTDTTLTSTDDYAQWPVYIKSSALLKAGPDNISAARSKVEYIEQSAPNLSDFSRFNLNLAIAYACFATGDRENFDSRLDTLTSIAANFSLEKQTIDFTSQLVFTDLMHREFERAGSPGSAFHAPQSIKALLNLAVLLKTAHIYTGLFTFRQDPTEILDAYGEWIKPALEDVAHGLLITNDCDAAVNYSMFGTAAQCAQKMGWTAGLEEIALKMESLGDIPVWDYNDPTQCVAIDDVSGMRSGAYLAIARTFNNSGDYERAKQYFHKTLTCRGNLVLGARSLAAVAIGNLFTQSGELDSAEKYWAAAELLGSPFADEVLDGIEQLRASLQLAPTDQDKLLAQYSEFTPPKVAHPIQGELQTEKGPVSYDSEEAIFLLFSSIGCSVCTELMPGLHRDLKQLFPPENIIIVSEDPVETVKAIYGKDVNFAPMDREVAARHQVQILPSVQVVRRNNIEFIRSSLSNTTFQQLKQLFGPQEDK